MDYSFTSPALIFPAISLLMLAYTQRFLTLSDLVRQLHKRYLDSNNQDKSAKGQMTNIAKRINIIRYTQMLGALSFSLATLAMIAFRFISESVSLTFFILALLSLLGSLLLLMYELHISVNAIKIQLQEMKD